MITVSEQRREERQACKYPILCSSLNGRTVYSAVTVDYCERGIGFISRVPLKNSMTLFFRTDLSSLEAAGGRLCRGLRGTGLVQIRWCSEVEPLSPSGTYRIGARYVEPYP